MQIKDCLGDNNYNQEYYEIDWSNVYLGQGLFGSG